MAYDVGQRYGDEPLRQYADENRVDPPADEVSPIGPLPALKVIRSGDTLLITSPASVSGAALEMTDSLPPTAGWVPVAVAPVTIGDQMLSLIVP